MCATKLIWTQMYSNGTLGPMVFLLSACYPDASQIDTFRILSE